jgi:Bacterial cellulose synthase subunit.
VHIPPLLLTPRAQVRLHFFYDIPNTGECHGRLLDNVVGASIRTRPSTFVVPALHGAARSGGFANSGFPFTRMADLSETAVSCRTTPIRATTACIC